MKLSAIKGKIPDDVYEVFVKEGIEELRPAQEKAIQKGLLYGKSLLVCTPTASGKTLVAELAAIKSITDGRGKAVYVVPLVALAREKYNDFRRKYGKLFRIALSVGDYDSSDRYLADYDLIISTAEKVDSLIRHQAQWLPHVSTVIVDEIHMMDSVSRGPTVELLITIVRQLLPKVQLIALSATIGNPAELAEWLNAELVEDSWRPVKLYKGVYYRGRVELE